MRRITRITKRQGIFNRHDSQHVTIGHDGLYWLVVDGEPLRLATPQEVKAANLPESLEDEWTGEWLEN